MPKVSLSIIVANYNNAHFLPDCLNSILAQSFKDFEVIVSDDCSTDNSKDVILDFANRYPDKFVTVFHKKNKGIAFNRHSAILQARGEYITTLDSDDYFADETKLEKEIALVMEYKQNYNEDIIAFSNILQKFNDGKTNLVGNEKNIVQGHILEQIMSRSCMIPRDFIFARKIYLELGGYDITLPIYEDWDLKIRIASKYRYFYTGHPGIVYLRHGQGLSNANESKHIKVLSQIFNKNKSLLSKDKRSIVQSKLHEFVNRLRNRAVNANIEKMKESYRENRYFQSIKIWCRLAMIDPTFLNPKIIRDLIKS